ncbi:MAG: hypothetical protein WA244_10290 [Candidatus Acidiferrales bacterium]
MRITSADRTLALLIASPGLGFVVTVDGHAWFFDRDSRIATSVLPDPEAGHQAGRSPERCPRCRQFTRIDFSERS